MDTYQKCKPYITSLADPLKGKRNKGRIGGKPSCFPTDFKCTNKKRRGVHFDGLRHYDPDLTKRGTYENENCNSTPVFFAANARFIFLPKKKKSCFKILKQFF